EFARRFAFAHLRMGQAVLVDLAVGVLQLAGLAWLASTKMLSAITGNLTIGVACALTASVWLFLARRSFVVRWTGVRETLQPSWSLGKWLFATQVTFSVQAYFVHWLLAWTLGPT